MYINFVSFCVCCDTVEHIVTTTTHNRMCCRSGLSTSQRTLGQLTRCFTLSYQVCQQFLAVVFVMHSVRYIAKMTNES